MTAEAKKMTHSLSANLRLSLAAAISVAVVSCLGHQAPSSSVDTSMSDRLAHEVRLIRPPTGWRLVDTEVGNKSIASGVSLRYTGTASTSYLQRYIRSEFKKNGWT